MIASSLGVNAKETKSRPLWRVSAAEPSRALPRFTLIKESAKVNIEKAEGVNARF